MCSGLGGEGEGGVGLSRRPTGGRSSRRGEFIYYACMKCASHGGRCKDIMCVCGVCDGSAKESNKQRVIQASVSTAALVLFPPPRMGWIRCISIALYRFLSCRRVDAFFSSGDENRKRDTKTRAWHAARPHARSPLYLPPTNLAPCFACFRTRRCL